jgi:cytochrome b
MEKGFSAMGQVDIEDEIASLIDDFSEKIEIHQSFVVLFQVLVGAHDAAVIAEARQFHPKAYRQVRECFRFFPVVEIKSA